MLSANEPDPPVLRFTIPKRSDLTKVFKHWKDVQLPIDILLLTVKDCEFLACYFFLRNPFRSYLRGLGYVYFGQMGERDGMKLKIGLIECLEGATQPGGALVVVRNAVEILLPKAVFCVGYCGALHRNRTKLGDVVVSSKLTTYADKTVTNNGVQRHGLSAPVGKDIGDLIRYSADGWVAPLQNPEARKVTVHCDGEFLSGPEEIDSDRRREELVRLYPNALAIEMDGQGVFSAAHDLKMEWVVIKGVSDYADGTASLTENWRPFASFMAASVVNNILREPVVFEQWPHYQNSVVRGSHNEDPSTSENCPPAGNTNVDLLGGLLRTFTQSGDSGQLNYKGRDIHYSAHGRIHSWREPWVFDGRAWDLESGISTEARHYNSSHEAIQHAVQKLQDRLKNAGLLRE